MLTHSYFKRVRYGETDQMGYLYYGHYPLYYEIGRVELLRSLGISYRELEEEHGVMMPVVNMNVRYLRPARYDAQIEIRTTLRKLPNREIVFHFELLDEQHKILNGARVSLCFVNRQTSHRITCPPVLLTVLSPHFE